MDYSRHNDIELIALLQKDITTANNAFNIIFLRHLSQVFGYCLYKTQNRQEAEDLMQETWIRFFNSARSGKTTDNILALLFTIARNLVLNKFRKSQGKNTIGFQNFENFDFESLADPFSFQADMEKKELLRCLEAAVNCLDEIYKETVLLFWFGEMTFKEIAKICEETEACIRRRFERAVRQLHQILEPYLN